MNEEIVIRSAATDDLHFVMQDGCIPKELLEDKIAREEVILALCHGHRAGYARFDLFWSVIPWLTMMWVLEGYRGRGVAKAILCDVEATCREAGHSALYSSSDADNPDAQAWHRRVGFHECGFIAGINDGGVGEVVFRKAL